MMSTSFGAKIASTRPSGLEKIVGRHQIFRWTDGQTDSFSALYIYIDCLQSLIIVITKLTLCKCIL